jgi:hypothetical protein
MVFASATMLVATAVLTTGAHTPVRGAAPAVRAPTGVYRAELSRLALGLALGAAAAPLAARAACDPTTGEECLGNFWDSGRLTYSKADQLSSFRAEAPAQSGRTILRLTARLQRQRAAFDDLAPLVALGECDEARRRLRAPPLDNVRKASSEIALLASDTRAAGDAQRRFTAAIDGFDVQLMRVGRRDRSADGLAGDFSKAAAEFDTFLAAVGVPKPERAAAAAARQPNVAPASLR